MPMCGSYKAREPLDPSISLFDLGRPDISFDNATNTFLDTNGCTYTQLFLDFPILKNFYLDFEKKFNAEMFASFADRYMWLAFVVVAFYLAAFFVGERCMRSRERFNVRKWTAWWNLALSVFSTIGFLRTAPHLVYFGLKNGFYHSVCAPGEPSYGHGAVGLWTMLFIFSKVPELVDTLWLVLAKREVIFLHWYHHASVLLYCWHSYATRSSAGLYFVAMNYGVHALMYFYFYLTSLGYKPSWNIIVTTLQISQMFVGMFICGAVYYFEWHKGLECDIRPDNYIAGLVMYASYAVLFLVFAFEKYFFGTSSLAGGNGKAKKAAAAASKKVDGEAEKKAVVAPESQGEDPAPSNGLRQRKQQA